MHTFPLIQDWMDAHDPTRFVLPNRSLFMLAEQPPTDMASLLGMFSHMSPVLRRRLKELLDTIREAQVDEHGDPASTSTERAQSNQDAASREMEVDQTTAMPADPATKKVDGLWTGGG